ncbi:MAG TPA: methionine adenosyltransferase [Candidatus Saccharimonadales bacterium]|nr:methionine adenosyltransferase [Candidatus Saccharimonadales bacterium]
MLSFPCQSIERIFNLPDGAELFTSESVCAGHPDKICDGISDAILDAALRLDPQARTAVETVVGDSQISLFGEVRIASEVDYERIVRERIAALGYTRPEWKFSDQARFSNFLHSQAPEIAVGVDKGGAGDQGMMFGYACKQTREFMPLPIMLAHALTRRIDEAREAGELPWLRPDGKAQVTVRYEGTRPLRLEKTVLALAHDENTGPEQVREEATDKLIKPALKNFNLDFGGDVIINGTGVWHIPGPESDAGLTGRKIVVDTYGGYARVGGGAFSGKDPSKVDRSGAYAARYIAKNIVAHGLADECEVGLAYVIGRPKPLMETIETFGTAKASDKALYAFMHKLIDTSVEGIIETLDLRRPIYSATSVYGHFGKDGLPWEKIQDE